MHHSLWWIAFTVFQGFIGAVDSQIVKTNYMQLYNVGSTISRSSIAGVILSMLLGGYALLSAYIWFMLCFVHGEFDALLCSLNFLLLQIYETCYLRDASYSRL